MEYKSKYCYFNHSLKLNSSFAYYDNNNEEYVCADCITRYLRNILTTNDYEDFKEFYDLRVRKQYLLYEYTDELAEFKRIEFKEIF